MSGETILCPKCGSDQLSTQKHGYSAGKAIAGAVVTGGIGLLAGFHGSNKLDIYCLKCGKRFKAGEGKVVYNKPISQTPIYINSQVSNNLNHVEKRTKEILRSEGLETAIKYYERATQYEYEGAKEKVIEIAHIYNIKGEGIPIKEIQIKNTGCLVSLCFLLIFSICFFLVQPYIFQGIHF